MSCATVEAVTLKSHVLRVESLRRAQRRAADLAHIVSPAGARITVELLDPGAESAVRKFDIDGQGLSELADVLLAQINRRIAALESASE